MRGEEDNHNQITQLQAEIKLLKHVYRSDITSKDLQIMLLIQEQQRLGSQIATIKSNYQIQLIESTEATSDKEKLKDRLLNQKMQRQLQAKLMISQEHHQEIKRIKQQLFDARNKIAEAKLETEKMRYEYQKTLLSLKKELTNIKYKSFETVAEMSKKHSQEIKQIRLEYIHKQARLKEYYQNKLYLGRKQYLKLKSSSSDKSSGKKSSGQENKYA